MPCTPVVCWVMPSAYMIVPGLFWTMRSAISLICPAGMPLISSAALKV